MSTCDVGVTGWINVTKSFYTTFDGKRRFCSIPELYLNESAMQMHVVYKQGDEESYVLRSSNGIFFSGAMGTDDDNRVDFEKWVHDQTIVLAGNWKSGGRQGEWYIEGVARAIPA